MKNIETIKTVTISVLLTMIFTAAGTAYATYKIMDGNSKAVAAAVHAVQGHNTASAAAPVK
jgi:hypothetical protein